MFVFDLLACMCLAALWSTVGKGAKADVAGPAGPAFAGPTFWPRMLSAVSLLLVSARIFFELTSVFIYETLRTSLIDLAKVLKQAVTEIGVMGRVARKPEVVAFQQQRHRPACTDAQSDQRLYCSISGKYK